MNFDGKVAIVTGAARGLGRSHALMLAKYGCRVVVNDLGGSASGEGSDATPAQQVCDEIKKAGGQAVPDYNSVVDGDKIVDTAVKAFGTVHIVIHNAGILRDTSFVKMKDQDWDLIHNVHLNGVYKLTKAAWPHMAKQKWGRFVFVSSAAGLYGNFGQANYSSAKLAVVGFNNTLAKEGERKNIKSAVIAPIAASRMTATVLPPDLLKALRPEYVSPLVTYLVSEDFEDSGAIFEVGAGWVSRVRWQRSKGAFWPVNKELTPENIAEKWDTVNDFEEDPEYPMSPQDSFGPLMANLNGGGAEGSNAAGADDVLVDGFNSSAIFHGVAEGLSAQAELAKKLGAIFQFDISAGDKKEIFTVDLKKLEVYRGKPKAGRPTTTFVCSDDVLVGLATGEINPQSAFMQGKLKLKGNMQKAMSMQKVFAAAKAKL